MDAETLDELSLGGLKLYQSVSGYRYSLDPILLANFIHPAEGDRVLDLGTGSGVLALIIARLYPVAAVQGIEIQPSMAERALRNVTLNQLENKICVTHGDLRSISDFVAPQSCQLVVSNPPFRPADGGRIAPDNERAMARHQLAGDLNDFILAARSCLIHGGRFAVIYLAERLAELLSCLTGKGLEPKRLRMIHGAPGSEARLVMVEARKGGKTGLVVLPPLYIYEDVGTARNYSAEVLAMYDTKGG